MFLSVALQGRIMFWCSAAGWSVLLDLFFAHLQRKLVDDPSIFYEM